MVLKWVGCLIWRVFMGACLQLRSPIFAPLLGTLSVGELPFGFFLGGVNDCDVVTELALIFTFRWMSKSPHNFNVLS